MTDEQQRGTLPEGALVGGRFKVERMIGRGGMGEVYAARHMTTGKEVALKLIHATAGAGKEHVRRFLREARAATAIEHPNVIEVFDVFEDEDGTPVMVMELLKGEPFSALRERAGALELHQTAEVLLPAVRALQAAHAKGIIHRDLKPDNIFLANTASGRLTKLLDFGIAKVLDPTQINSETQGQNTNTGSILGTPHYMSFEQAMSDKHVDHRTDIWAMGVMIFESLTGRRPMTYDTLGQMYASFLQGTVPSIRDFVPDLPDDAAHVIDRCLGKQREDRLGELEPLVAMLEKYSNPDAAGAHTGGRVVSSPVRGSSEVTAAPLSSSVSRGAPRGRSQVVLIGAVVVAAGIGVTALALSRRSPPAPAPAVQATPSSSVPATTVSTASTTPVAEPSVSSAASSSPVAAASASSSSGGSTHPRVGVVAAPPATAKSAAAVVAPAPSKRSGIAEQLPY